MFRIHTRPVEGAAAGAGRGHTAGAGVHTVYGGGTRERRAGGAGAGWGGTNEVIFQG